MKVVPIRLDQVDIVWPHVAPLLERAIQKYGHEWSIVDLYRSVRTGNSFLHVSEDMSLAITMAPTSWRGTTGMRVAAFGAKNQDEGFFQTGMEMVKEFSRGNGAKWTVFDGSKAYQRIFPEANPVRVVYEVKL